MTAHANLPALADALGRELARVCAAHAGGRDYAVDLADVDLSAATLACADLRAADFTGADLEGAGFEETSGRPATCCPCNNAVPTPLTPGIDPVRTPPD